MADDELPPISLAPIRVVAGEDESGRAVVLSRGTPTGLKNAHGVELAELWRFDRPAVQATDGGDVDPASWTLFAPTPGATTVRLVRFTQADPTLHRTSTIDLMMVIDGEIDLMLDDGATRLHTGDTAVLQGCMHGYRLVDGKPCTMVAVMITTEPHSTEPNS
jgi:hypothetical protein